MASDEVRREVVHSIRQRLDDIQVEQKLIEALCRQPDNVREWALKRCFFAAIVGDDQGGFFVTAPYLEGRTLVVLNGIWGVDDFQSAVAHEIAHLWLGHPEADLLDGVQTIETKPRHRCARGASQALDRFLTAKDREV
jgi:hypothetical protein